MRLIIGLGNPGRKYKKTRHNIGFRIIDEFQKENDFPGFKFEKKFQAEISEKIMNEEKIILAKPQTFMNSSGVSVKLIANFYKIQLQDFIVIHDDIDLPFGKIKLSKNKNSAGHKGVESIIQELGSKDFSRIRIGISPEFELSELKDFVLKKFSRQEEKNLKKIKKDASGLLASLL